MDAKKLVNEENRLEQIQCPTTDHAEQTNGVPKFHLLRYHEQIDIIKTRA